VFLPFQWSQASSTVDELFPDASTRFGPFDQILSLLVCLFVFLEGCSVRAKDGRIGIRAIQLKPLIPRLLDIVKKVLKVIGRAHDRLQYTIHLARKARPDAFREHKD